MGVMMVIFILTGLYLAGVWTSSPVKVSILLAVFVLLSFFVSLTTEIKGGNLRCSFGFGFIRRSIAVSDISDAKSVRNPWLSGWGIRWWPGRYWLWNVSGYQAVELVLQDGKRFRIGTDKPGTLVHAIRESKKLL